MDNQQKAFITGFIKAAENCGIPQPDISELVKAAIFTGPAGELSLYGAPSALGYLLGRGQDLGDSIDLEAEKESYDNRSLGKILKYLMVPGYTGYRVGKRENLNRSLRRVAAQPEGKDKELTQ